MRKKNHRKTKCDVLFRGVSDLEEIYNFASKYDLRVVEDAAHAFGTKYKNKLIGSFGDISCFSFDGIKTLPQEKEDVLLRMMEGNFFDKRFKIIGN